MNFPCLKIRKALDREFRMRVHEIRGGLSRQRAKQTEDRKDRVERSQIELLSTINEVEIFIFERLKKIQRRTSEE